MSIKKIIQTNTTAKAISFLLKKITRHHATRILIMKKANTFSITDIQSILPSVENKSLSLSDAEI